MTRCGVVLALLALVGCGEDSSVIQSHIDAPVVTMDPQPLPDGSFALSSFFVPVGSLLRPGESATDARIALLHRLVELYPELVDEPTLLPSLRGEAPWVVLTVPPEYRAAAPLMAKAYQLMSLERREKER